MIKRIIILNLALCLIFTGISKAQDKENNSAYEFKIIKEVKTTPVKNQYRSSTCWSFSGLSFIESELLRMGKPELNLSEAWVIRNSYSDKAISYVRWNGNLNFAGGGAFHDVTNCIKKYGIVPEKVYDGLKYGTDKYVHNEFDAVLSGYIEQVIKNKNKELSTAWHYGFEGILDAYLGKKVENFNYEGKNYTPKTFADEYLKINPDDYVELTSFTHHPFYSKFIMEVPDNWAYGEVYNVKLDELIQVINNAINNGYSVAWGGDMSEKGFSWKNGVAIVPDVNVEETSGSDKEKWTNMSKKEKEEVLYSFEKPVKEMVITQELRQKAFDNYQTTDDHGMHLVGIAKDQSGNTFYKIKNSWDTNNIYDGYLYMSEAFVKYKVIDIMVHKDAVPKDLRKKLNL